MIYGLTTSLVFVTKAIINNITKTKRFLYNPIEKSIRKRIHDLTAEPFWARQIIVFPYIWINVILSGLFKALKNSTE